MNEEVWEQALKGIDIGPCFYFDQVGSTNDVAQKMAAEGVPDLTLVVADEQVRGRGRQGRSWFTHRGAGLAFSVILLPESGVICEGNLSRVNGLGALSVARALRDGFSIPAEIKWPNDVLVDGKKVCGVLVESHWKGDQLRDAILGIGINIAPASVPREGSLQVPAASLQRVAGQTFERPVVLARVLEELVVWYPKLPSESFLSAWEDMLAYRDQEVQLLVGERVVAAGKIAGLGPEGALRLVKISGKVESFHVGEIHLRPVDRS
jgi:BirA family biotin operon repressor/biotin-[acetyl-CoA-carboxylase] ligase